MRLILFILLIIFIVFITQPLRAQGTTAGFGVLELPLAARNAAMGEGNVADISHRLTALINPALLAGSEEAGISISHQNWIQDVSSNFLFVNLPFSFASTAISVSTTTIGGIEVREIPGPPIGTFDARTAMIAGTIALQVEPEFSIGASIKHVYEKIYVDEAASVLFDIGAQYISPIEGLSAGIALKHFGIVDRLRNERATLPTQTKFGVAYETNVDEFKVLGVLSGTSKSVGTKFQTHIGAECIYAGVATLRLGYQTGYTARGFSGGLGVIYANFEFDYGYLPFSLGLGTGHLLTLGYYF